MPGHTHLYGPVENHVTGRQWDHFPLRTRYHPVPSGCCPCAGHTPSMVCEAGGSVEVESRGALQEEVMVVGLEEKQKSTMNTSMKGPLPFHSSLFLTPPPPPPPPPPSICLRDRYRIFSLGRGNGMHKQCTCFLLPFL